MFAVGGQEGASESVRDVDSVGEAYDFRGKFGEEVVGGKVGDLEIETLAGVGEVVESVGVHGHGGARSGSGSGEVTEGEAAVAGVGVVGEGEGEGVEETAAGARAGGGVVAGIVAYDGVGGEAAEAGGGGQGEVGAVVAGESSEAVAPVMREGVRGVGHSESRFVCGNDEVGGAEVEFQLKIQAFADGEGAGGGGLQRGRLHFGWKGYGCLGRDR